MELSQNSIILSFVFECQWTVIALTMGPAQRQKLYVTGYHMQKETNEKFNKSTLCDRVHLKRNQ